MPFLWVIACLGAVAGGLTLVGTFLGAASAPQQAAGAAFAAALAVVPYVFARGVEGFLTNEWRQQMVKALGLLASDATLKTSTESLWQQLEWQRRNGIGGDAQSLVTPRKENTT